MNEERNRLIVARLNTALARVECDDGEYSAKLHGTPEHNPYYTITYTPNDRTRQRGECRITLRSERTGGWHTRDTGKVRLIVEGEYRGPSALQYPQWKDGKHSYDKAVANAVLRARDKSATLTRRYASEAAIRTGSDIVERIREANNVPVGKGVLRARENGIRLTLSGLGEGDADLMIKAAKAAGIELQ